MSGKVAAWAKQVGENALHLHQLKIGPRLTLCFLLIILVLLLGYGLLVWQFVQARAQASLLSGADEELITVLQVQASLTSFYERLDFLARSENTQELVKDVEVLRKALLQDSQRARNTLNHLPREVQPDPTLLPTLVTIQGTLSGELESIPVLAESQDWDAVRLRLANQIQPLESRSTALVENIDREVAAERAQAISNIGRAQTRILFIVPVTAGLTLLFAAFLGLAITRSITHPLGRLMEGANALAEGDFTQRIPASGNDEIASLGNVFNDMTVRLQRLYRELQRREHYLSEAQRLSHTGSFITDLLADDHNWSEETFRIFEFDPAAKVTIQKVRDAIHPDDLPSFDAVVARCMTAMDVDFGFRIVTPGGAVKHVRGMAHVMGQSAGHPVFIGAFQDVTESKLAEEALNRARSELAHVTRITTLNALTISIAHEINQPLSGIVSNASATLRFLSGDAPNLEEAREAVRDIIRDGKRAGEIISRIRALTKKAATHREKLDLNETISEVLALIGDEAKRQRVIVRTQFADSLPPVAGDRIQLQQVVLNLAMNAMEAMNGVSERPRELVVTTQNIDADCVQATVEDSGTGIAADTIDKIYDSFYTTKPGGMGMGLSISRSILQSHGGRLWAVSKDAPGTMFHFTVPKYRDEGQHARATGT